VKSTNFELLDSIKQLLTELLNEKQNDELPPLPGKVRIAVYDDLKVSPRLIEVSAADYDELIGALSTKVYQLAQEKGSATPFTVIKELVENLLHARFKEVTISILNDGSIKISDQGPGISNKEKALEPGFTTATAPLKRYIKGVGSGLPIANEAMKFVGGNLLIEDNLSKGTVITLKPPAAKQKQMEKPVKPEVKEKEVPFYQLNERQKKVLFLIMEYGAVGPSQVAKELLISLSTAYRDLSFLESLGLLQPDKQGKRCLTSTCIERLDELINL